MNLQALRYLTALAEHRHFGRAAEKCFVTQPTLSMQIRKLEDELGLQLLERNNKSVRLTDIGLIIAEYAQKILREVKTIQELAKTVKDPYSGNIKMGVIPTLAPYLLPRVIGNLQQAMPKLQYYWVEKTTEVLMQQLKLGEIDAALISLPIKDNELVVEPLFTEEFLLAVPKQHALVKRKTLQLKDIENSELLLLEEGHCLRDQALTFCQGLDELMVKDFRATSLETLRYMVAAGLGITLTSQLAVQTNDNVHYLRFSSKKPQRKIGLAWRKTTAKAGLFREIAGIVGAVSI